MSKWVEITAADITNLTATPGTNRWTTKPGCPTTQVRTFNAGKYAGIGPRIYAEMTAADGVLYWCLFIDDAPRRRGGTESRCIARGQWADVPPARSSLKALIARTAMAHVRKQLDAAIARTIDALAVSVAEHEGIAKATADLDLADARAVIAWDRDRAAAEAARDNAAARLDRFLKLTKV
jgi:hypothetical protein